MKVNRSEKLYKPELICESEVAYESNDHLFPWGARMEDSQNKNFNRKLYKLLEDEIRFLKILDIGCSGGSFVKQCIDDGCFAVGLEGSDYSKRMGRGGWPLIKDNLFTCDVSKEFSLIKDGKQIEFDVVTAWDLLEHIEPKNLDRLIKNIKKHMTKNALFIGEIGFLSTKPTGVELHRTRKPKEWWVKKFAKHGFIHKEELYPYFNKQYVRGRGRTHKTFNIILGVNKKDIFKIPKLKLSHKIFDRWCGSKLQMFIQSFLVGYKVEK